ncbi:MAG: hypothetical protein ABUT20_14510 [Bacteroidota bacterium]
MELDIQPSANWPAWRKIAFRFFFVYLILQMQPWGILNSIPGVDYITQYIDKVYDWAITTSNAKIFHIKDVLVYPNGSGDTSYAWAQFYLLLLVAFIATIIWSFADRKRSNYQHLNYWLCLIARYYISFYAFVYGILKLFAMQMFFPNLSQLATPLGDFLPMRLSWMFIGYSTPYQVFSGVMEVLAGLLLLNRRTTTLGVLFSTAVFMNVLMLNLAYDVPVKLFSAHLLLICLFLMANECNRIICFFILNKPAGACTIYHFPYNKKWMRITRVILKTGFIILAVLMPLYNDWEYYKSAHKDEAAKPIKTGVYDVARYVVNKDTIPFSYTDSLRWQDIIFDKGSLGSIKSADTSFRQRYRRAYFYYDIDSTKHSLVMKKFQGDSLAVASFIYSIPDSNTLQLSGKHLNDSLFIELKRSNRHFQLAEKQFHWLSEANR